MNIEHDPNAKVTANIWDKLNLEISNIDDLEDINWEVLVIKKNIVYDFWRKKETIFVGANVIKEDWLWDIIVGIKKELDMIQ